MVEGVVVPPTESARRLAATAGLGYDVVDAKTAKERVTGFHLVLDIQPGFSPGERLSCCVRTNLPDDAVVVGGDGAHCLVWRSPKLKKLLGLEFAVAMTATTSSTAAIRAQSTPRC